MAASLQDIKSWFSDAQRMGATHMIIKCDTYDYSDYPVYVMPNEDVFNVEMSNKDRTMEVYAMHISWDTQSKERRAVHYESKFINND